MGYYINPRGQTKEEWLAHNGLLLSEVDIRIPPISGYHYVCLVDNGWMKAAGIAYCEQEKEEFAREDGRPKKWYLVADELLREINPDVADVLK